MDNGAKNHRSSNAFKIFVQENTQDFMQDCPGEDKAKLDAYLLKKWKSMPAEDKRKYFDKHKALKKLENDMSDSNPTTTEQKITQKETADICLNESDIVKDNCAIDKSFSADETYSSFLNGPTKTGRFEKQKPLKKPRRSANAFLIFAKEQGSNLDLSSTKEKCHRSTVLSHMWRELPDIQKEKYVHEARRLQENSQTKLNAEPLRKILKNKRQPATIPEKPIGRSRRKKELCSDVSSDLRKQEVNDAEKSESESSSKKPSDVVENAGNSNLSSERHACNNYLNSNYLQQYNNTIGNFHRMPSAVEPHHSRACCHNSTPPYFNNCASLNQNPACDASMPRLCCGAGSFSPAFASYPYNIPPWMYNQSMVHHSFPFSSPVFYPSPYNYSLPYPYNSAYNGSGAYIGYYSSQYSRRIVEPSTYPGSHPSTSSATSASVSINEDTSQAETDDEQLVVDEGDPNENTC